MSKSNRLGDGPIQPEYIAQMQAIARNLDSVFNGSLKGEDREVGFVLLVFPFGTSGRANYISNGANRKDMITLLREQADRFEESGNA